MDLITPRRHRLLKNRYKGKKIEVGSVLYNPLMITEFEITKSLRNEGKEMLVMQVEYIDKDNNTCLSPVFTESYTLISTIRGTESKLPHYAKIIRKRDGYYYFVMLNNIEKNKLLTIK